MSDHSFNDSFEDFVLSNESVNENKDLFDKLLSNDFENESVLMELSTNEELPQIILNYDNYRNVYKNSEFFEYVLGLCNLMQKLSQIEDQIIDLWIKSSKQTQNCIFSTLFQYLPKTYFPLNSPKVVDMSQIDNTLRISFYEYICFNVCQLVTTLSANHFNFVEQLLFENLLSEQSVCNLLASDVICFTGRLTTESPLCYQFCALLMSICVQITDTYLPNTTALLYRLIPFLKPMELEFLLKDYDLITHSRIWSFLNVSRILSEEQIKENFKKFHSIIENENSLTEYDIKVFRQLFATNKLNDKSRENAFVLILNNFFALNDWNIYSEFIDLLTVLLPKHLNESNVSKLIEKLNHSFNENKFDSILIEKIVILMVRLSNIGIPVSAQNRLTTTISSSLKQIYANIENFYSKYALFKAMTDISLKSKQIPIITECCKDQNFKQEFVDYLKKMKNNESMDEIERNNYLQNSIVYKLQTQCDFNSQQSNEMKKRKRELMTEEELIPNGHHFEDCDDIRVNQMIDAIEECVKNLKQNQSLITSGKVKQRLLSVSKQFNGIIDKMND